MATQNASDSESRPAVTPVVSPSTPATAEDFNAATRKEYGQYVAKEQIFHGYVLAYNAGDPVPASNVALYKYDEAGTVVKVGTKAHQELMTGLGRSKPES